MTAPSSGKTHFHKHHNLHLRLDKPAVSPTKANLPVLYCFHGGGFCVSSRTWPDCHNCCLHMESRLGALVDAPDFRLAPEHWLPTAVSSLKWLEGQAV
ncbi:hypothetical protein VitviT2T_011604 [Vitis vinifera]|uniref:Alpha/beta hydrolase fold-3 domain-containing protein n=1 Tax=Vitis vinifera TaxID=29760 RepID=A0ABY9CCZ6_VITVI|nr:hypothetical protein VitviT2T_011604 [Vitis vinifera]